MITLGYSDGVMFDFLVFIILVSNLIISILSFSIDSNSFVVINLAVYNFFQPIVCLIGFLECNIEFTNKISRTLRIYAFRNICSDARPTTQDLFRHDILVPISLYK